MTEQAALQQGAAIRLFEEALPGSLFERLVRAVRAIGGERLKRNYTTTFWLPKGAEPTNVAEEAAVELSRLVGPTSECSGIEWWLGRLGQGERLRLHFDRDMTLRKKTGQFVHPLFASVLYLNSFPASPTVVLGQMPSSDGKTKVPEEPEFKRSFEAVSNRYVVFPGNLRHGVLPDSVTAEGLRSASDDNSIPELRLTLLVNFWVQRPLPPICFDYDGSIYGGLKSADVYPAGNPI